MRGAVLSLAVVAACCVLAASEPVFFTGHHHHGFPHPFLGGHGHHGFGDVLGLVALGSLGHLALHAVGKRSVSEVPNASGGNQEAVLSTLAQLDPKGCLMKLLCHLETKDSNELTRHETILTGMFREATEAATPASAAFIYAVEVGSKSKDPAACDKLFSKCPFNYSQLSSVLEESFACPIGGSLLN